MFGRINKKKKFTFYTLVDANNKQLFFTVALTKEEVFEYLYKLLGYAHIQHFTNWCELKGYDQKKISTFKEYYETSVPEEEKAEFYIAEIYYTYEGLASVLRMFGGCSPLNCSFELPVESAYFKEHLGQVTKAKKYDEIAAIQKQIEEENNKKSDKKESIADA